MGMSRTGRFIAAAVIGGSKPDGQRRHYHQHPDWGDDSQIKSGFTFVGVDALRSRILSKELLFAAVTIDMRRNRYR